MFILHAFDPIYRNWLLLCLFIYFNGYVFIAIFVFVTAVFTHYDEETDEEDTAYYEEAELNALDWQHGFTSHTEDAFHYDRYYSSHKLEEEDSYFENLSKLNIQFDANEYKLSYEDDTTTTYAANYESDMEDYIPTLESIDYITPDYEGDFDYLKIGIFYHVYDNYTSMYDRNKHLSLDVLELINFEMYKKYNINIDSNRKEVFLKAYVDILSNCFMNFPNEIGEDFLAEKLKEFSAALDHLDSNNSKKELKKKIKKKNKK